MLAASGPLTCENGHGAAAVPGPAELPAAVERVLADFVREESAALMAVDPALQPLVSAARAAVLGGGKRVRPLFAYWGWRSAAGPHAPLHRVLPALAALELLHAFALVHDDVMDRSDTRRGRPTAHRQLAATHTAQRLRGDADRFGDAGAILVGDLCLVWADRLMARADVPAAVLATARAAYDRMRIEAVAGQFLDVLGDCARTWSPERALRTARLKTAGYTATWPLHFGAALAGSGGAAFAHGPLGRAFTGYGLAVGEAFQLRDDLLGLYGEPAVTGKPVGDDLGKPTMLLLLARQRATPAQAAELDAILAAPRPDVGRLAAAVRVTGAAEQLSDMIGERVADARAALGSAPMPEAVRDGLGELAAAVAWRAA
ncbi:polyprenyl synthetase family protein [Catellatospora sp. KI3]|uniref:polyprenyl synthetase family protein n=1 Tax=Catellatospora sp. KI3 TaxID=3041620 RepID=UPI0024831514|nr:polyprenyl synthetase family protein [Catellatospora sp. KI3]MDI1462965.1 polyprenyl synthetase family protein [Catellatospora sp. KI3]